LGWNETPQGIASKMATNQEARQTAIRAVTSTTGTLNEDWLALFTARSAPAGTYNERLLSYINTLLSASHTNLEDAMQALAADQGADNFSSMGMFTP
jgi:hypothetical protein